MVNMIIDGKHVSAEENITIMEAAESASWSWKEKRS